MQNHASPGTTSRSQQRGRRRSSTSLRPSTGRSRARNQRTHTSNPRAPRISLEQAPESHVRVATQKHGLVEEVLLRKRRLGLNGAINVVCARFRGLRGAVISPTSLRRWVAQFETHGVTGLVRQQRTDRGLRRSLLRISARHRLQIEDVERIIGDTLLTTRGNASAVLDALVETWPRVQWNQKTVQRWSRHWKAENLHLLKMATDGEGRFIDQCGLYLGWDDIAALAWAALDSSQLDQFVSYPPGHPKEGLEVRPWVSLMLDLGSRCAITFEVTLTPPTPATMKGLLRRAWCAGANWPGLPTVPLPKQVRVDAGAEHKGAFQQALQEFQLDTRIPKGMPERQPH